MQGKNYGGARRNCVNIIQPRFPPVIKNERVKLINS